jgi:tRNA(Ile)-lysidine synthase
VRLGVSGTRWALALSGGPDSTALLALLAELNPQTQVLIVDHALRASSASEAAQAAAQAENLGLTARILRWEGEKPTTGLMAAARQARYRLLLSACEQLGITHLFLAHHADDQQETVQLRQARGSGWRGLAGMPWCAQRGAVTLVRPLLDVPKQALLYYCATRQLRYVIDPSNSNPRFARAQLRLQVQPLLPVLSARRADELAALQALEGELFRIDSHGGYAELELKHLLASQLALPLLRELIVLLGQEEFPPSEPALEAVLVRLQQGRAGVTLGGCRVQVQAARLFVVREPAAMPVLALSAGEHHIYYDKRWRLSLRLEAAAELRALGRGPWRQLGQAASRLESLPGPARAACPVVWSVGGLMAVPDVAWTPFFQPLAQMFVIP